MAFDFPATPTVNQNYQGYTWDGEKWVMPTGSGSIYVSDTAPAGAPDGILWFESDTGNLYFRFNDGTSSQWIAIAAGGPADAVLYNSVQTLTTVQQARARTNIGIAQVAYDTSWIPFAYLNGWADYDPPFAPCGYRMLPNGMVILKGIVRNGTAANILTLPAGYRPGLQLLLSTQTSPNATCRLDVQTNGIINHTGGNNGWLSLNGITFLAEN